MNEEILNVDRLQKLIKYVPTPEEVQQIRDYSGEPEDLAQCEQFFYQFVDMDNIKDRLEMCSYKQTFKDTFGDNKRKVDSIVHTCELLKDNGGFKQTLAALLAVGNYLNGSAGKKGGQHGFALETLDKFGDFKTTDNTMSLLGYIFLFLRENYPDSLNWVEEFGGLPEVCRIETDNLEAEIAKVENDLKRLHEMLEQIEEEEKEQKKIWRNISG